MSGGNSRVEPPRNRQVLSDVTNYLSKRGYSLIAGDVGLKSGDGSGVSVNSGDDDLHFAKHRCLGSEKVVIEKCRLSDCKNDSSLVKIKQACGLLSPRTGIVSSQDRITSKLPDVPRLIRETSNSFRHKCNPANGNVTRQSILEVGDASKDSSASTVFIPTYSGLCYGSGEHQEEERVIDSTQSNPVLEGLAICFGRTGVKDPVFSKLGSRTFGSIDHFRLPKSLGSKDFSLERCTGDKAEGRANLNNGDGVLRECTCSLCLKAAYIWSDLHYQDINGRIAALKKSQKEASVLVRNFTRKDVDVHGKANSNKSSKLESDLTSQWRSLFLHSEDILICESKELQTSFLKLKELREDCRKDLEMFNAR